VQQSRGSKPTRRRAERRKERKKRVGNCATGNVVENNNETKQIKKNRIKIELVVTREPEIRSRNHCVLDACQGRGQLVEEGLDFKIIFFPPRHHCWLSGCVVKTITETVCPVNKKKKKE